jgi:hypothetical protein
LFSDLKARGSIDLRECFIDGTFTRATKGGIVLAKRNLGKAARSWSWQTLLVFLPPCTSNLLRRMKSPLFTRLSSIPGWREYLRVYMTVMGWMRRLLLVGLR